MTHAAFPGRLQAACTLAACLLISAPTLAQTTAPVPVVVTPGRLAEGQDPPTIDGKVDDAVWETVQPHSTFTQQDPRLGEPATERTEVRLLFGPTAVYVSFVCFDEDPSKIIVSQARRDASLAETEAVIAVFDTFNDNQNAFVFGTNPLGIEYDGQVAREGQTGGMTFSGGAAGTQRGQISSFNPNWDGDWTVRAQITERGWEAEMAIPLKTLRYTPGENQTWGFNVMRNIRHKNEQVYMAFIPRGFDIYRISLAAKVPGLTLPQRRDIKLIPYVLGSANQDFTRPSDDQFDGDGNVGIDVKWGVRPNLTLDATVNTDFAQVEADEEQVNLTRFDLFFPEKRPFFLENATTFQFGQPQSVDLFFSRRIGLSGAASSLLPIPIIAGGRLSGKVAGSWNVGLLNIQTNDEQDSAGNSLSPDTNFTVLRAQKEYGRSSYGAIFVGKFSPQDQTTGTTFNNWNRAYGVDANWQMSEGQRLSTYFARTDTPETEANTAGPRGSDYSGRAFYDFRNRLWQVGAGFTHVGDNFNPEVGFLPRRGYRRPEMRVFFSPQPKNSRWIRRYSPHVSSNAFWGLDGKLQTAFTHIHLFEIQPMWGGRFGWASDQNKDNPTRPFTVYSRDGNRVVIPVGDYTWWQNSFDYIHDPSAAVTGSIRYTIGNYYDGDFNSLALTSDWRFTARMTASVGWTRQDVALPGGAFVTHLIPVKASYSFTNLASLSALVQYNGQSGVYSSNIRLALLNRSGTGLFVVYNDRRDVLETTSYDTVGRSFVVKYTRLIDF